ncbi:MAG: SLC26A/SulP transporter family protein [Burkholderiales bacterium]|nr:SLC26A/SulP transporter family protein [Burkholderiales bacterium]
MSTRVAPPSPGSRATVWRETQAGAAGMLLSLGPALTLGLLAFAALGGSAAALGIPAALVSCAVGGAVFSLLSRGPMPAAGPSATPALVTGALVARIVSDPAFSLQDPAAVALLLALVGLAVVSMGLLQVLLGLSGLVRFAKFVPQPVLAGFMNGVALLALLALLPLLIGLPVGALQSGGWAVLLQVKPASLAVGLFTVAVIVGLPRLSPRLPATLVGLLAGSGAYALLHATWPAVELGPLTGQLPRVLPSFDTLLPLAASADAPLLVRHGAAALSTGLVLALLGTLELVLNSLALDQACHTRTDPRREVVALGLANTASGLAGGLPLLLLRPRALRMIQAGGRSSASALLAALAFALVGWVAAPLLALLPQVVLGAVLAINAYLMADRWSLRLLQRWWRGPRSAALHATLGVVAVVCITTVVLGFAAGVALGSLLSVLIVVRSMNRSFVRACFSAAATPSRRIYPAADEARLQTLRHRITVMELEGALFFGTADRVAELADQLPGPCHALVLDFRRVSLIDASGAVVLAQLARRLHDRGTQLLLAGVTSDNRHGRTLRQFAGEPFTAEHGFADVDQAVEKMELQLLAQEGCGPPQASVPVEQVSLMDGLDAGQRARLAACLQPRRLAAGERLFSPGDPGDQLFVIVAGSINVFSDAAPSSAEMPQRYVTLSAGMILGETAMLDGGGRSGEAVADGEVEVRALDGHSLQRLRTEDPVLYAQVYRNIALHLSQRLRAAAWAWRASMS